MREDILSLMLQKSAEVFGMSESELSEKTRFADLDAKSAQLVQITTYLEDEFDVEIPFMNFKRQQNIGEAVSYVLALVEE